MLNWAYFSNHDLTKGSEYLVLSKYTNVLASFSILAPSSHHLVCYSIPWRVYQWTLSLGSMVARLIHDSEVMGSEHPDLSAILWQIISILVAFAATSSTYFCPKKFRYLISLINFFLVPRLCFFYADCLSSILINGIPVALLGSIPSHTDLHCSCITIKLLWTKSQAFPLDHRPIVTQ